MVNQSMLSLILLAVLFHCTTTTTLAQSLAPAQPPAVAPALPQASPPAPPQASAPAPSGPINITKILEKAGRFTTLIRLLGMTKIADRITTLLNTSQGVTVFAPTDTAFSDLPVGTVSSLSYLQRSELLQFHVLSTFASAQVLETMSNPVRTLAGDVSNKEFPLNITSYNNQVNISTGIVKTNVDKIVFSNGQLIVYQVDKVLLPMSIFGGRPAPAPGPAGSKPVIESVSISGNDGMHGSVLMVVIGVIATVCL